MTTSVLDIGLYAIFLGVVATAILDVWAQLLKYVFAITPTNWALVGRWFAQLPKGRFWHADINRCPVVERELLIGWLAHYLVGVGYALIFLLLSDLLSLPLTLQSAIGFGLLTVLAPWLILQPGLGLGRFAVNTPNPAKTRFLNIISHTVFGLGLFVGARLLI